MSGELKLEKQSSKDKFSTAKVKDEIRKDNITQVMTESNYFGRSESVSFYGDSTSFGGGLENTMQSVMMS